MEVVYLRDRDKSLFTRYENALSDGACYADVWNSIWIRSVSDISDNYDKRVYAEYPLLDQLVAKRIKAYLDVENGEYLSEEFSTERLKFKRFDAFAKMQLSILQIMTIRLSFQSNRLVKRRYI